ncbi:MAG: outer membrane beta-barrel protein [Nitrospinota bacterium]|nr:outer membrane beta-barrel protein [Nitrospinota bacterium]
MKKTIQVSLFLLITLVSLPAQADTLYFAAQAGFSTQPTSDNEDPNNPANNFELNTQNGVNGALAVGAKFGMLRGEIEAVYRYNPNDKFVDAGMTQEGADGSMSMMTVFLNGYIEFDLLGIVTPYAGLGIGYGTLNLNLKEMDGTVVVDDKDEVYAYQLMAGAAFNLTESWSLTGEYRYFDTISKAELTLSNGINFIENSDISAHEVRFGIRYWFF